MADEKYIDLTAKYLSGNISDPEKTDLLQWTKSSRENQTFFDKMAKLWGITANYEEEPFETDLPVAWSNIEKRIDNGLMAGGGSSARIIPLSTRSVLLRVAAVALLIVAGAAWFSGWLDQTEAAPQIMTYTTAEDESRVIYLPDGSIVSLNENSRFSYLETFDDRKVDLEGEAFFEVSKQNGETFTIHSGEAQTTVLGTSFNVRAYPEEKQVEVMVQEGKVALGKKVQNSPHPTDSIILQAGQAGVFSKDKEEVKVSEIALINADAWKTGIFNFNSLKVSEVVTALERRYDVRFEVEDRSILDYTFNGQYKSDQPLENILKGMEFTMELKYSRQDSLVFLRKK